VTQWLHCAGDGPVTTVIVPGLGSTSSDWTTVFPALSRLTRTCTYDRPGLGRSPARDDGRDVVDAGLHARELAAALEAAGERGPYLVAGHSYGGLVARAFVAQHRPEVAAVMLAESVTPGDPTLGDYWNEDSVSVDLAASSRATQGGPPLGATPLLVMTASRADADRLDGPSYGQGAEVTAIWLRGQRRNLTLSSDSMQVVARSGHVLQKDAPETVAEGVRELLAAVESGRPLACTKVWAQWDAACRP
jgi:pimeloyl-ACP methyl ester carboxylesterase